MSNFLIERETAENDFFACAAFLAERIGSLDGHAEAISPIAARYAELGELDLAAELVNEIQDPHTRDSNLAEIAGKCAEFDDDEYALQLADAIEDYSFQEQAKTLIAVRQAEKGRFNEARATAETLADSATAFGEIAIRYARNGEPAKAREILATIDLATVRVQVLNEMAAAEIKNGNNENAVALLEESSRENAEIEFPEEKVQILLDTAVRFSAAQENKRAAEILDEAQTIAETLDDKFSDQFLTQIAVAFAHIGNFAAAEKAVAEIEDLHQAALAHSGIALENYSHGGDEKALENLEEAWQVLQSQPANQIRSSEARFGLWGAIAVRFAQFGKPERALEIALANPEESNYHAALRQIAAFCAAQNRDDLVTSALKAIHDLSAKTFALIALSDAEDERGDSAKALQTLHEAHGLSEEVPQLSMRSNALDQIAVRLAEHGETVAANDILFESLQITQKILDQSQQSRALFNLAAAREKIGTAINEKEREILSLMIRKAQR